MKFEGTAAVTLVTSGVLFWSNRVSTLLTLPIKGWYLKIPIWGSVCLSIFVAMFFLFYSGGSGRSAALAMFLSAALLVIGRKSRNSMLNMSKHLVLTLLGLIMVVLIFKGGYQYAAPKGWLGENAMRKYERIDKSNKKTGLLSILMSGRLESFTGLRACFDKPIIGFGAKAIDRWGYYERMLDQYGSPQDYANYLSIVKKGKSHPIPAHSHIIVAWIDSGIFGLLLWCYILYLLYLVFRRYPHVIPQWYGYFALSVPDTVWDIFFSPFGDRIGMGLLITCILLVSAIRRNRIHLPMDMEMEAQRYDH